MEIALLAAVLVGASLVAVAIVWTRRGAAGSGDVGALAERLGQLTDSQAAQQAQLARQMQAQERALAKALDARLQQLTSRVNDALERTGAAQKTTLDELKERLVRIDAAQQNIATLSSQVVQLQDVLANKQARGAFGEIQLRDLVSAILPPSAYEWQATVGGNRRADCLLRLPNPPGPIAIDAKFPLESYHALRNAADDTARVAAVRRFAIDVGKHIRDIAEKYIVPGETAEAALMFLPSEAVYAELHANHGDVVEKSYRARVFIVSPTTLWATLNTVRAVMKDVQMKEAAGRIQAEVLAMLGDVERLDKRVGKLQRHYDLAAEDMRQIRVSTEKIGKRGDNIQELQLEETAEDDQPKEISTEQPSLRSVNLR